MKKRKYGSYKDRSISKEYRKNLSKSIKKYFKTHSSWNKGNHFFDKQKYQKNYKKAHKKEINEYIHKYHKKNKIRIKYNRKKYYKKHKEFLKAKRKLYYQTHKEEISKNIKEYYKKNKSKINKFKKLYYKLHAKKINQQHKEWYKNNKEKIIKQHRQYNLKNRIKHNKYISNRLKTDINFKIRLYLRNRIRKVIKKINKSKSIIQLLGCSVEFLRNYLEQQFKPGMSWSNYGKWHIDHKILCASFDLSKPEEQRKCFHYKNLQPLWASENLSKSDKII